MKTAKKKIDWGALEKILNENKELNDTSIAKIYKRISRTSYDLETIRRNVTFLRNYLGIERASNYHKANGEKIIKEYLALSKKYPDKSAKEISFKIANRSGFAQRTIYYKILDYKKYGIY